MKAKTANVTVKGIDIDVEFDHQPKEHQTRTYPGCPESVCLTEVKIKGVDLALELLSNLFIELIEEKVLEAVL